MLTFDIGSLLSKPVGVKQDFDIDEEVKLDDNDEIALIERVTGHVQFIKLPHEISVNIQNLHSIAKGMCVRCLSEFVSPIDIAGAEREFIVDLPDRDITKDEDVSYVNNKTNRIELDDMIRDEILLHFPPIAVCSESCKGLCDRCGANLNDGNCSHADI